MALVQVYTGWIVTDEFARQPSVCGDAACLGRGVLWRAGGAALLTGGIAGLLVMTTGAGLAWYLLGPFLLAVIVPPLVAVETRARDRLLLAGGAIDGVGCAWLIAAAGPSLTLSQWFICYLVIAAFGLAIAGLAALLARVRLPLFVASFLTSAIGLIFLGWPVWMSPWIRSNAPMLSLGIATHPPLVLNGVLRHLGFWSESAGYEWTVLGQDVAYALPDSALVCIAAHVVAAIGLWTCGHWRAVRPSR